MKTKKPVIGLVGAIGAGKSTVAKLLATRGGMVIDADRIGHEALDREEIRERLVARWGNVLKGDGLVDRRALARIVFENPAERHALEQLLFPIIRRKCEDEIQHAERDENTRFVVLDAAVMLEAGWNGVCDYLVYVDAPRDVRLQRLAKRSGWTAEDLDAREAAQMPAEVKKRSATDILMNDGRLEELELKIGEMLNRWNVRTD